MKITQKSYLYSIMLTRSVYEKDKEFLRQYSDTLKIKFGYTGSSYIAMLSSVSLTS